MMLNKSPANLPLTYFDVPKPNYSSFDNYAHEEDEKRNLYSVYHYGVIRAFDPSPG